MHNMTRRINPSEPQAAAYAGANSYCKATTGVGVVFQGSQGVVDTIAGRR